VVVDFVSKMAYGDWSSKHLRNAQQPYKANTAEVTAMHVTLVHVSVKSDHIDDFIEATRRNHEASVEESGNRRFDVLQSSDDPGQFVLYEAYASAEDAQAHKQTKHYLSWRDTVAAWMAAPRRGVAYSGLFPRTGP
jgi:autoinducer 2-degrading protein